MKKLKIGIVGCGAIGEGIAMFIQGQLKSKAVLYALADISEGASWKLQNKCSPKPLILETDKLIDEVDLVVEAASIKAALGIIRKSLSKKRDIVVLSVGALVEDPTIVDKVARRKINLYIPSGAICGTDGLGALSLGKVREVFLTTSKPVLGLEGANYLKKNKINLRRLKKPKVIFKGTVKEAIKHFPKNINVAATLLLAAGSSKVGVCIKADPSIKRNIHRIEIKARDANVSISVENVPSKANPKTSALAILSAQYLLKKIMSSLKIGA